MNSEQRNEIAANDSNGRVLKIREAGALALNRLDQLRPARPMTQEVLDAEVARIALEKQHRGFVVHRVDSMTPFVIRLRGGEIRIRSRFEFLPKLQSINSKNGGLTYGLGS
ncbi:MAG: hypothetical protein QOH41_4280 [Blastocatellia bacterium]|jgi:hypothetical protein|nr:hypothetical protein [Blastocatellia bacterium]